MNPKYHRWQLEHWHLISLFFTLILYSFLVSAQNTGTAVELKNVDTIDVETANKARIEAELRHEEQARKHTQNVVRLAATDQLNSEIITNRTRAYLSCESGEMIVKINFTEPFRGVGYSDYDRSSPCKFYGDGGKYYELRLPLKGCGTKQEAPRIFINNIVLRFHRSLELEEDEIKTIICRYPPPLAPPPPLIVAPILQQPPVNAPFMPAHLSEVELILIVSALVFLTLLLLGIGMGYYCLKRRNIKVVRKVPPPPYIPPPVSLSSSETYYESDYDDMYRTDHNLIEEDVEVTHQNVIVPPLPVFETRRLDECYVTNASNTDVDEDVEVNRWVIPKRPKITAIITDDYYVTPTTTTEVVDEITTHRLIVPPEKVLTTKRIEDTFISPEESTEIDEYTTHQRAFGPRQPVLTTHVTDDLFIYPEENTEVIEEETTHRVCVPHQPKMQIQTVDDYYLNPEESTDITEDILNQKVYGPKQPKQPTSTTQEDYFRDVYEIDEILDDSTTEKYLSPLPTTKTIQTSEDEYVTQSRDIEEFVDDTRRQLVAGPYNPKITVKNIDDFYVTNIVETEVDEKVIRTGRSMPNLLLPIEDEPEPDQVKPKTIKPDFDVTLRSIPLKDSTSTHTFTDITTKERVRIEKILHVIDNPPFDRIDKIDELLPQHKREKLRTIIITDETFQKIVIQSTTIEEYTERVIHHPTYGPMFEPPTWEIIFKLFSLSKVFDDDSPELCRKLPLGSIRSHRSGLSAHEVRSITEEDVSFSRHLLTSAHYVPPPDYPTSEPDAASYDTHWASQLPDPKRFERQPRQYSPLKPAFTTNRRPRQRVDPDLLPSSSVFGARRLANPYTAESPFMRRRLLEYGSRPYSPDIDALSLEPSQSIRSQAYVQGHTSGSTQQWSSRLQSSHIDEREEIKSTTETDVYDWKRYT